MPPETPESARRNDAVPREQERVDMLDNKRDQKYEREGKNLLALSKPIAKGIENLRNGANDRRQKDANSATALDATANHLEQKLLILLHDIDTATVEDILNRFSLLESESETNADTPLQKPLETPEEKQKRENEQTKLELRNRYDDISLSIRIRMTGAVKNIEESRKTLKKQSFIQSIGSNEKSGIAESENYYKQLEQLQTDINREYGKTRENPALRTALLKSLSDNGQLANQLRKASPDFKKLRAEFDRTMKACDIAEQGIQYAQTVLEIAASYAGPPGIAAALIPKYIVELTTGSIAPDQLAWKIVEDIATAYIGGGKFSQVVLKRLGPVAKAVQKIFESGSKQGWTATIVKKTILEFIDMFKDQKIQHAFAYTKEQITGQEAHRVTIAEMIPGRIIGKVIGKGLDKTGVRGKIEGIRQEKTNPTTERLPTFKNKTVLVGDVHIGLEGSDGIGAKNKFDALARSLKEMKKIDQAPKAIVDTGDFLDKVGERGGGTFREIANSVARSRLELARDAGIDPKNYFVVTGNHDLPATPVLEGGKPKLKKSIRAFDKEDAQKMTTGLPDAEILAQKLIVGETPTEKELAPLLQKRPDLIRTFVETEILNADIQIWKEAHKKAGLTLVTSDPSEEWTGKLPGEEFETVLKHYPVNDGPNLRELVNPNDRKKLKEKERSGNVGRQIGADIHTLGIVEGENWKSGKRFQTIQSPAVGGGVYEGGQNGFLLLGDNHKVEFLQFEPGTTNIAESKAIPTKKGLSKPKTPTATETKNQSQHINQQRQEPEPSPHLSGKKTLTAEQRRSRDEILALPDTPEGLEKRIQSAVAILETPLTPAQSAVILKIHKESPTKSTGVDERGNATYAPETLKQWIDSFQSVGIDQEHGAKLLRMGVCGSIPPPPPPPGNRPKPTLPPPPLPPRPSNAATNTPTPSPQKLPNGMNAPPPPPKRSQISDPETRKTYLKEKKTELWQRTLSVSDSRTSVYDSERGPSHIIWIKESRGNPVLRDVGADTVTHRYLTSPADSSEHAIFLKAEQMMMRSFQNAKKVFPKQSKLDDGFFISKQGEDIGMSTGNTLGIAVNSDNTDTLLLLLVQAERTGNYSAVDKHMNWIQSALAHEMTHNVRRGMDDKPNLSAHEVPSHAIQFLSIWDKNQDFFTNGIAHLSETPRATPERIHAALGGLKTVQRALIANRQCIDKPVNFSPAALQKAIRSIPESVRQTVIQEIAADILRTPITDFESDVRAVFEESKPR